MKKIKVAILGASGYTGAELIRILINHPFVEIVELVANSNAGQPISQIYPHLNHFSLPILKKIEDTDFSEIDAVFGCLPHTTSQSTIQELLTKENGKYSHLKIIDLSADFRLKDPANYQLWYEHEHVAKSLQKIAIYGLPEINRQLIKKSSLVASAGCYPTSALLPLIPLLQNKLISSDSIIIDSKSGTSGAGRSLKTNNLFCEVNESVKAYSIGKHRHIGEIEQELSIANGDKIMVEFTPHLLPINRGIISTIYVNLAKNFAVSDLQNCLTTFYEDEYFVNIIEGEPNIKNVVGTNICEVSVKRGRKNNQAIIVSVIDNLCKGASGQAVQNFNIMFGLDEDTALKFAPTFP